MFPSAGWNAVSLTVLKSGRMGLGTALPDVRSGQNRWIRPRGSVRESGYGIFRLKPCRMRT